MYRIAYLSHVSSTWVRQRPHIIFEGLSSHYDVAWFEFGTILDLLTKRNVIVEVPLRRFRHKYIYDIINSWLVGIQLKTRIRKMDLIWVTSPLLVDRIEFVDKKIVYDCMDDFSHFYHGKTSEKIASRETDFLSKVDQVIFSSLHLMNKYEQHVKSKKALIRNAINSERIKRFAQVAYSPKRKVVYWGTISSWFDWGAIDIFTELGFDVEIYGPVEGQIEEKYQDLLFGPVDFELLPTISQGACILIMPFRMTELIKGVDPVKLYEYIATKAIVVAPYYPEIERFSDFIFTYHSYNDLKTWAKDSLSPVSENIVSLRREFLKRNTWEHRISSICHLVNELKQ